MTQQRSDEAIRADVKYLNDHEAQTGRRSSAHVLLTHDVEPLLARVSELEQERDELREQYTVTAGYYSMYYDMRARAERAEAQIRAVEARVAEAVKQADRDPAAVFVARAVRAALAAGLSLQEEQE